MTEGSGKLLLWSPRILGILVCLFLSLFALDAFEGGKTFLQALPDFAMHITPMLILLAVVGVSWRWEWVGGLVFTGLAVGYAYFARDHVAWILGISGPLLVVGVLFLWSWRNKGQARPVLSALLGLVVAGLLTHPSALRAQELVSIPAPDGGTVEADLYGAGERGVVLAHGGRFDRASWAKQGRALADAGFRVLAIDFRAAVQTRAGQETACLYDEACLAVDVLAAVRHLRKTGAKTVALVGASLGGGGAAQATVDGGAGEIDRVVLLAHMPIAAPEKMKGRKLFIVSRGDLGSGDVPRLPGIREQYEKAADPKELVILEGSAHAQFIFETPEGERLTREILRFLSAP